MKPLQWDDSLSVGVGIIDAQHKELIRHLNDLVRAVAEHQGEREISRTLSFLVEYARFHFDAEERHMATTRYPKLAEHQARHQEFRDTLRDLEREYREDGATKALADALNRLLNSWLVDHIGSCDRDFGVFLGEKGIQLQG
jgi:hemerythrin